jgi:flagellar biosynthesis protein FlhB
MAEDMGEKTENATPKKLQEARSRGQVPKSSDINAAVGLAAAIIILMTFGPGVGSGLARIIRDALLLDVFGSSLRLESLMPTVKNFGFSAIQLVAPLFLAIVITAYLTQLIQVGLLFTFKPLKPKISQLNPVAGIKKLIAIRSLVKSGVNILKLVVVIGVAYLVVMKRLSILVVLPRMNAFSAMGAIGKIGLELAIWLVILLLALAFVDLVYQRWQHKKDLKMTKHEVKDERRSMEGDPQIKGKRMRLAREIAMQRMAQDVPNADVIIANPTHFSVAIRYDEKNMDAPIVVAKGADFLALRIRQFARFAGVPIIARPPLARALYWGTDVGDAISSVHFEAVAELLAYVYRMDAKAEKEASAA